MLELLTLFTGGGLLLLLTLFTGGIFLLLLAYAVVGVLAGFMQVITDRRPPKTEDGKWRW